MIRTTMSLELNRFMLCSPINLSLRLIMHQANRPTGLGEARSAVRLAACDQTHHRLHPDYTVYIRIIKDAYLRYEREKKDLFLRKINSRVVQNSLLMLPLFLVTYKKQRRVVGSRGTRARAHFYI